MDLPETLVAIIGGLTTRYNLLSWSIFPETPGMVSVKLKFLTDSPKRDEDSYIGHYKRKAPNQAKRDRTRAEHWRSARQARPGPSTPADKPAPRPGHTTGRPVARPGPSTGDSQLPYLHGPSTPDGQPAPSPGPTAGAGTARPGPRAVDSQPAPLQGPSTPDNKPASCLGPSNPAGKRSTHPGLSTLDGQPAARPGSSIPDGRPADSQAVENVSQDPIANVAPVHVRSCVSTDGAPVSPAPSGSPGSFPVASHAGSMDSNPASSDTVHVPTPTRSSKRGRRGHVSSKARRRLRSNASPEGLRGSVSSPTGEGYAFCVSPLDPEAAEFEPNDNSLIHSPPTTPCVSPAATEPGIMSPISEISGCNLDMHSPNPVCPITGMIITQSYSSSDEELVTTPCGPQATHISRLESIEAKLNDCVPS